MSANDDSLLGQAISGLKMTDITILIDKFGINLRQLVAILDCQKPEASEHTVMVQGVEGEVLALKAIRIEPESETVWLLTEDY